MLVLALVLTLIVCSSGRDICAKFGLKSFNKNEKNVVCYNSTSRTVHSVSFIRKDHVRELSKAGCEIFYELFISVSALPHLSE